MFHLTHIMSTDVPQLTGNVTAITENLKTITDNLKGVDLLASATEVDVETE